MTAPEPEPQVSVIITNWNYANYLPVAIESVLGQTRSVHELIVVDDGSTDSSRTILNSYGDRIVKVLCENGGQAAAFNAGFARSTGDIIIFLDADDALRPEAIETITTVWTPSLAAVCYGMELIDREGVSRGIYPVNPSDLDQRPHLIETGDFTFLPTSANAFARHVAERACPLPVKRWKISADAYLLRVAALSGRILPLPHVLGSYRIHESNNYHRVGAAELWRQRRDRNDIADLASYFAGPKRLWGDPKRVDAERLRLRMAAVRAKANLFRLGQTKADVGAELRRLSRDLITSSAPVLPRLALASLALAASLVLWRNNAILSWLRFPEARPVVVRGVLASFGHNRLRQYEQVVRSPRWRAPIPLDVLMRPESDLRGEQCLRAGWSITDGAASHSVSRRASLSLLLPPTPSPLEVELELTVHRGSFDRIVLVEARIKGELITRTTLSDTSIVRVPLPANTAAFGADVGIDLSLVGRAAGGPTVPLRRLLSMPATVTIDSIRVRTVGPALDHAPAEDGRMRSFADFIDPATDGDWGIDPDGSAVMFGSTAKIGFTARAAAAGLMATIALPLPQPRGWMRIAADNVEVYGGQWGESAQLWFRIPLTDSGAVQTGELAFAFAPADVLETSRPRFSTIAFRSERTDARGLGVSGPRVLSVNPGQQVVFRRDSEGIRALGAEWLVDDRAGATLAVGEGEIRILLLPGMSAASAAFAFEPVFPAPDGQRHVVTISAAGRTLARALLAGEADISVPLQPAVSGYGPVTLTVRSVFAEVDESEGTFAENAALRPAPVGLRSLRFSATVNEPARIPSLRRRLPGRIEALLEDASTILSSTSGGKPDVENLKVLRQPIITSLETLDQRALLSLLTSETTLPLLMRIGIALGPVRAPHVSAISTRTTPPETDVARLREILIALVSLSASEVPWLADLRMIPAPLLWRPAHLAAYLGKDPRLLLENAGGHYERFVLSLIRSADTLIAEDSLDSPRRSLATETMRHLWPQFLLFLSGSHKTTIQALGRYIERSLILDGYLLARAFPEGPARRRLRVGISLRNSRPTPEGSIVRAMLQSLDRDRFEPILIVLSSSNEPAKQSPMEDFAPIETARLDGLTTGEAVDLVRGLGLDIFVQGAFFNMLEHFSAIAAHRLAPVQLVTAAIFPVTTGLSSFDGMLSSDLIEPPEASDDYVESLVRVPGPIQAFAERQLPQSSRVETPTLARIRLGLPLGGILMASGAMMQKIGPDLMAAWAEILATVPKSYLVLYPYAANWNVDFATEAFETWAASKLAARGVAPERLRILRGLTASEVRSTLRAVDLYLDSFPYAGAATVTEALEEGLPVVSLRGEHQRGRQGAGWLAAYGLDDDIAASTESYVKRTVALATNENLLAERRRLIEERNAAGAPHSDLATFGKTLSDVLIEIAASRGIRLSSQDQHTHRAIHRGQHRYLFHHQPGAAGTTAIEILSTWLNIAADYPGRNGTIGPAVDREGLGPNDIIVGRFHPPHTLRQRYPEILGDPAWRVVTLVRDPLELSLSRYFRDHSRHAYDPSFRPRTLREHLAEDRSDYVRHFDFTPDNWREVLDRYWFIGTVERLEESLQYIADELGAELPEIPNLNATPRPIRPDPADVDAFARRHAPDYQVYNEIREQLDRKLRG